VIVGYSYAACEIDKLRPHLFGRNREIDKACRDRAFWHVGMLRSKAVRSLRQGEPTTLLDRLDAQCAVAIAT
jgi:hypothetical protein